MAWPTTDATTTALDSGTDDPNIARPQIKLNIENANAMANEFGTVDITSPTNEQLLQYNSASSKWVNATVSTGGGGGAGAVGAMATLQSYGIENYSITASGVTASSKRALAYTNIITNKMIDQVLPINATNQKPQNSTKFTFEATGTYDLRWFGYINSGNATDNLILYNATDDTNDLVLLGSDVESSTAYASLTVDSTTDEYYVLYYNVNSGTTPALGTLGWSLEIIKTS